MVDAAHELGISRRSLERLLADPDWPGPRPFRQRPWSQTALPLHRPKSLCGRGGAARSDAATPMKQPRKPRTQRAKMIAELAELKIGATGPVRGARDQYAFH